MNRRIAHAKTPARSRGPGLARRHSLSRVSSSNVTATSRVGAQAHLVALDLGDQADEMKW